VIAQTPLLEKPKRLTTAMEGALSGPMAAMIRCSPSTPKANVIIVWAALVASPWPQ
jgi:hypothetical protein